MEGQIFDDVAKLTEVVLLQLDIRDVGVSRRVDNFPHVRVLLPNRMGRLAGHRPGEGAEGS